ncbi:hypothetical protein NQ315_014713, partial [Exocentrus adspersus]
MPVTCLVVGCGSRSNRNNVNFYSVPAILSHKFVTGKNELSKRRRALWIAAIKRDDLNESKLKNQRVCSKHFITGKPAALEDENHPDWVPSQEMGHKSQNVQKRYDDVERKERLEKRKRRKVEELPCDVVGLDISHDDDLDTGVSSQTDITMEELSVKSEQLTFASKKIGDLEKKWIFHHSNLGITPQGTVSYISKAWGGRASDKQIVEHSNFLDYIMPGDIVLADRGFLVKETLGVLQAKLVIPAFTKGKSQLHPLDIEETRRIAH